MDSNQQDLVAQYCAVTGADPSSAQTTLASANWNLQEAVTLHFAQNDESMQDAPNQEDDEPSSSSAAQPTPSQPQAASSSSSRKPPSGQRPKQMTINDLKKAQDDDDSEDEHDKKQDMFAGGEKSGLAVQNPDQGGGPVDHFKNIMNQARQNRDRPPAAGEEEDEAQQPQRSNNFAGRAQTLGGDDAPSEVVEDPRQGQGRQAPAERVSRTLHLWADGVSIDDGPLFRFDDPANQGMMQEINRGRAPLALLDVKPDQEVDLNLEPHKDENYVQPKQKYKPFSGQGQRLGSPTPSAGPSTTAAPAPSTTQTAPSTTPVNVNDAQPTLTLRIQLGDGTRLTSRFNTTHTVGDVYAFVDASRPESAQRAYALMTTFPSKELEDRSVVLGQMKEFERGGVVVQKWK